MNFNIVSLLAASLVVGQLLLGINSVTGQVEDDNGHPFNATSMFNSYPDEMNEQSKCQLLEVPFCEKLGYNKTMLPNFVGQSAQSDIIHELSAYSPLMRVNCSPDFRLFLCSVYAPMCFEELVNDSKPTLLGPCRSLCEAAREGCLKQFLAFEQQWPQALSCEKFIEKPGLCVSREEDPESLPSDLHSTISRDIGFVCPKHFEAISNTLHLNGKTYNNCALPCDNVLLDKSGAQVVKSVSAALAIICLASTIFTCLTFLINTKRFKYPARPIIIIAFCQFVVAACYLLGFLTNKTISCNEPADPPKSLPNLKMVRLISSGNRKGICTLQFMALYFFQMSTVLWWLMMTVSWHMIARLKWAPEAVSGVARYFHLFSWTVPALLTIYLSVLGSIEGDPLSGTCYVSASDQESIRPFVVYPVVASILIGCVFLVSGFKSIWDSREALRREYGKQTNEHYKLVIRIGLFSLLFILSTAIFVYCLNYEQNHLNVWMLSWLSKICNNRDYSIPCPTKNFSHLGPHYITFVIKYGAAMTVGIISALFMLSEKTLNSYKEVAELCNYKTGT